MSDSSFAPAFIIKVNGQRLPVEREADVKEVIVFDRTDAPSRFFVRVSDFEFNWTDNDDYFIGSEFEISLGYKDEVAPVMTGEVTGLKLNFRMQEDRILTICGMCKLNRIMSNRMVRAYSEVSVSDIVTELAGEAGLDVDVENLTDEHKFTMIKDRSGLQALQDIAVRYDCIFRVVDGKLEFKRLPPNSSEDVTLEYGKTLLEFHPRRSVFDSISEVKVYGYNLSTNEQVTGEATKDDVTSTGGEIVDEAFGGFVEHVNDFSILDANQADQMAIDVLSRNSRKFFSGWGKARGDVNITAGSIVKLVGLGERFSQTYYVYAARHVLTLWGYVTYFYIDANVGNPGAQSQSDAQSSSTQSQSSQNDQAEETTDEKAEKAATDPITREIINLQWKNSDDEVITKAWLGDVITLNAQVNGIDDGTFLTINVFDLGAEDPTKPFVKASKQVKDGAISFEWEAFYFSDNKEVITDMEMEESEFMLPDVEFKVACKKYDLEETSDPLELVTRVFIELKDDYDMPLHDVTIKIIRPDGDVEEEGTTDEEGLIEFEEIRLKHYRLKLPDRAE